MRNTTKTDCEERNTVCTEFETRKTNCNEWKTRKTETRFHVSPSKKLISPRGLVVINYDIKEFTSANTHEAGANCTFQLDCWHIKWKNNIIFQQRILYFLQVASMYTNIVSQHGADEYIQPILVTCKLPDSWVNTTKFSLTETLSESFQYRPNTSIAYRMCQLLG